MISGRHNLTVEQGVTYNKTFTYSINTVPVDLSGYTARFNIGYQVLNSVKPVLTLTTENSGIVLGGELGTIQVLMSASQTSIFSDKNQYYYDLELLSGEEVIRLMRGKLIIVGNVL